MSKGVLYLNFTKNSNAKCTKLLMKSSPLGVKCKIKPPKKAVLSFKYQFGERTSKKLIIQGSNLQVFHAAQNFSLKRVDFNFELNGIFGRSLR